MCGGRDLHVDLVLRAEARELVLVDRLQHRERLIRALDAHGHAAHVVQHLQVVSLYQSQRCLYIIATDLSRSTCCAPPGRTTRGRTWRDSAHPHTPPLLYTPRLSRQQSPRCPCQEHHTRSQEHHTCVSGASHTQTGTSHMRVRSITHACREHHTLACLGNKARDAHPELVVIYAAHALCATDTVPPCGCPRRRC